MARYSLKIRAEDKIFFDLIASGAKTIETRAATPKYKKIEKSDILIFSCGSRKTEKKVKEAHFFESPDELLDNFELQDIMPHLSSRKEAEKIWHSFPNYKEKIIKYGLAVWLLE